MFSSLDFLGLIFSKNLIAVGELSELNAQELKSFGHQETGAFLNKGNDMSLPIFSSHSLNFMV